MSLPKISIIVPVYNSGPFLVPCLESILAQTFKDYEVLIVEDFSTDGSEKIVREYTKKYDNFRLIVPPEKGVAKARNAAISEVRGEYIAFIDSDDRVTPNYLEVLYNTMIEKDADVVCCNYSLYFPKNNIEYKVMFRYTPVGEYTGLKAAKFAVNDFRTRNYLWNKLWKSSLFLDNNIRFPDMYFEDIATVPRALFYAKKVVAIKDSLYLYTKRRGSIMSSPDAKKVSDYVYASGILRNFFELNGLMQNIKLLFFRFYWLILIADIYNTFILHIACRNFKYFFKNLSSVVKGLNYYFSGDFKVNDDGYPEYACKILTPPQKKKK